MQINSPYPSCLYLKNFIKSEFSINGKIPFELSFIDLNIKLINRIFAKEGLKLIFERAYEKYKVKEHILEEEKRDYFLFYYLNREFYINNIDKIVDFLKGKGDKNNLSFYYNLLKDIPIGYRIKNYLDFNSLNYSYEAIFEIFSLVIDELVDFINLFFDKNFKLSYYAYSVQTEFNFFSKLKEKILEAEILNLLFYPLLSDIFEFDKISKNRQNIFLITCPFPSCIVPSIYLGEIIKNKIGENSTIVLGGGYVSSELRNVKNPELFNYVDFLVLDKGYASIKEIIFSFLRRGSNEYELEYENLYKTIFFDKKNINFINFPNKDKEYFYFLKNKNVIENYDEESKKYINNNNIVFLNFNNENELDNLEKNFVYKSYPDYSDIDFGEYIRLKELSNPMYSLWSSEKWIKAFLAWGCWWRKCRFCDVNLDYINDFIEVDEENLLNNFLLQNKHILEKEGISGIHFVDEAMPIDKLINFSLLNIKRGKPFSFWGNLRLDKRISYDIVKLLSKSGLIAITVGAETVLQEELNKIRKGINLEDLIRILYFFKSEGVYVHLYLIYGAFEQTESDIVNMIEIVRQMFVEGIVDSIFFHRFVLTYYSDYINELINKGFITIKNKFIEKKENRLENKIKVEDKNTEFDKNIKIIESNKILFPEYDFAFNDLSFWNSSFYDRFDEGLNKVAYNYNNFIGLDEPISSFFDFDIVSPDIEENFVKKIIENINYEIIIDKNLYDKIVLFIGSKIYVNKIDDYNGELIWFYEGEKKRLKLSLQFCLFFQEILNKISMNDEWGNNYDEGILKEKSINIEKNSYKCMKLSEFAALFEERLKIPFLSFVTSKNFAKIKKNGLLII
ncbi:MAG: hypothetical protein N3A58_02935 [Spirochaetes bacterium]|nr:hypothetical protein [Spirochaetota bacterium]